MCGEGVTYSCTEASMILCKERCPVQIALLVIGTVVGYGLRCGCCHCIGIGVGELLLGFDDLEEVATNGSR